jgi:predicted small secreted protein
MKKTPMKSFTMTRLLPIAASMMICAGCAHYKVISSDRIVHRVKTAELFRAPVDGWFVPDARWLEIRDAMAGRIKELESSTSKPEPKE